MEELKLLIDMVSTLPKLAIWVVILFFFYKIVIIGSVWGVIKLAINRLHSWKTIPKHKLEIVETDIRAKLDGLVITHYLERLIGQVERLKGIRSDSSAQGTYIHNGDINWLKEAIDEKLEKEREDKDG